MIYLLALPFILLAIILILRNLSRQKKLKKLIEIKEKWGKASNADRNFNFISRYHNRLVNDEDDTITNEIAADIDLENIFSYIDRTNSKIGQQYLYHQLRSTHGNLTALKELDELASKFESNESLRIETEMELSKLGSRNAYYIHELFTGVYQDLYQKWIAVYVKLAGILWLSLLILTIVLTNETFFLVTLGLTFVNLYLHFNNKNKIATYVHSLPQIYILMQVAKSLSSLTNIKGVDESLKSLVPLKKTLSYINFQAGQEQNDISAGLLEIIKSLFLIEPAMFLISIQKIRLQRNSIKELFDYIAKIDMAISIQSLRSDLPYFSKPNLEDDQDELLIEELYHPLIENCVANSISVETHQGTLITGSNMSGKTTFIRSIVINALLAQTLYTSCTKRYSAPFLNLFTSIRINDSLEENQSYFQTEALSVLHILNESDRKSNNIIIIDEIFRGTNTIERIAAAKAILSYLTSKKNFVFVSTHDLELAELLGDEYRCYSFEETVSDTRLVFDYKIKPGILKNKNGIAILEAMGYPQSVVDHANTISLALREKYNL